VPEDQSIVSMRAERNVSTTPPPYDPGETADDPGRVLNQSRALEAELANERPSSMI
jgi:hypothetical protein